MNRLAIYPSLAILGGFAWFVLVNEWWVLGGDADAYYLAAQRIVEGQPLYVSDGSYSQLYRYAPWLAYLFVPLTVLPREAVMAGMGVVCTLAAFACLWPLRKPSYETLGLLLLIGPVLIHSGFLGNIQSLLVASVMYLPGRPVWIGVAASLKGAPLALSVLDAREGRWRDAAASILMTLALAVPMLAYDLSGYPTDTGIGFGLWDVSPWLTVLAAGIGAGLTWITRSPVWAAATVVLASPVLFLSYLSWLLVPLGHDHRERASAATPAARGDTVDADGGGGIRSTSARRTSVIVR